MCVCFCVWFQIWCSWKLVHWREKMLKKLFWNVQDLYWQRLSQVTLCHPCFTLQKCFTEKWNVCVCACMCIHLCVVFCVCLYLCVCVCSWNERCLQYPCCIPLKGGWECLDFSTPFWNLRDVIWFLCPISSLVLLPGPVALFVLSFFCYWSILLTFFQEIPQ